MDVNVANLALSVGGFPSPRVISIEKNTDRDLYEIQYGEAASAQEARAVAAVVMWIFMVALPILFLLMLDGGFRDGLSCWWHGVKVEKVGTLSNKAYSLAETLLELKKRGPSDDTGATEGALKAEMESARQIALDTHTNQ